MCRKVQECQWQVPPIRQLCHHLSKSMRLLDAPTHRSRASFLEYDRWAKMRPSQTLCSCDPCTPFSHCPCFCAIPHPSPPAIHPTPRQPSVSVRPHSVDHIISTWAKNRPSQDLCSRDICGSFWGGRLVAQVAGAARPGAGGCTAPNILTVKVAAAISRSHMISR